MSNASSSSTTRPTCRDECSFDLTGSPLFGLPENEKFTDLFSKMKHYLCPRRQYNCKSIQVAYFKKTSPNIYYKTVYAAPSPDTHLKCVLLNSSFNNDNYCYFYLDLMSPYQVTDRHGTKFGSHITFGPDNKHNGFYSIHNTEYYFDRISKQMNKKTVVWHKIDPNTSKSMPYSRATPSSSYLMKGWEHITGFFSGYAFQQKQTRSGKGGTANTGSPPGSPLTPGSLGSPGTPGTPVTPVTPFAPQPGTIERPHSQISPDIVPKDEFVDMYMEVIKSEEKNRLNTQIQSSANPFKQFVERFKSQIEKGKSEQIYMAWYSDTHYIVIGNAISEDEIKFQPDEPSKSRSARRNLNAALQNAQNSKPK